MGQMVTKVGQDRPKSLPSQSTQARQAEHELRDVVRCPTIVRGVAVRDEEIM